MTDIDEPSCCDMCTVDVMVMVCHVVNSIFLDASWMLFDLPKVSLRDAKSLNFV